MKAGANFYRLVQDGLVLIAFASSKSPKRRYVDEDADQILKTSSGQFGTNRDCEQPIAKKKGCRIRPGKFLYDSSRTFGTNRICEQRITKNEGMRMKAQAKNLGPVHEKYLICE